MKQLWAVLRWVGITGWFAGIYGFILSLRIIVDAIGFWGGLLAFILFPVTLGLVPWYAGIALHDWTLMLVNYGGAILFGTLYALGQKDDE